MAGCKLLRCVLRLRLSHDEKPRRTKRWIAEGRPKLREPVTPHLLIGTLSTPTRRWPLPCIVQAAPAFVERVRAKSKRIHSALEAVRPQVQLSYLSVWGRPPSRFVRMASEASIGM